MFSDVSRPASPEKEKTFFGVIGSVSLAHCLNDTTQSVIIASYPLLKGNFDLTFTQIGLLAFAYQICASVLQPLVGHYTDKHPHPHALPAGMTATLVGLLVMAFAPGYFWLLLASVLVGMGSAVFHPESSRVAFMAAGGRYGLAQSIFQVGGNAGQAIGPLIALFVAAHGQRSLAGFSVLPLATIVALIFVSRWATSQNRTRSRGRGRQGPALSRSVLVRAISILFLLMFSKQIYSTSIANYFIFYLMEKFGVSLASSQVYLFLFLGANALGTFAGGPIGDRIGRKWVIWVSILGAAPFALLLPYVDFFWTGVLSVVIGFIMASSFSAILVFAQELLPGHVGAVAGLFFGLSFGLGGIGAAVLGKVADTSGLGLVYTLCSFLPLLGMLTVFLPSEKRLV